MQGRLGNILALVPLVFYNGGMDSFDSRGAHSAEASTGESASLPLQPPTASACLPVPDDGVDRRFPTAAEQEAYWIGVRVGAETARSGLPEGRHRPAGAGVELTRDAEALPLVSTRLVDPAAAPSGPGRAPRHDGWTPEKERIFFRTLASTGVVADACRACGMSRDAAYNRRNSASGRAFALAWEAAHVLARPAMADDVQSRARHGVIDKIYRNGELVAERHRHDNRLAMAVLTRLDRLTESLGERAPAVQAVALDFDAFLDLLPGGNEAADAFLQARVDLGGKAPRPEAGSPASDRFGAGQRCRDVFEEDLEVDEMEDWTDDQLRRAEASGLVTGLYDALWPEQALDGEADGTDGMCKIRKLYLRARCNHAGEDYWAEE